MKKGEVPCKACHGKRYDARTGYGLSECYRDNNMRNVICVWNNGKGGFEKNIPLEFVARRNEKLGYTAEIDIVVLDGFDHFSPDYKNSLSLLNFKLVDCVKLYKEVEAKHINLARFGDYERKCFLRWIVLYELYHSEPLIHYDGDVVFNENPDLITSLLVGKTFVLQGCPAFTCIGDPNSWHEAYGAALDEFNANIDSYSNNAWRERDGWEKSEREKWAGQRFRKIISSDQDFLSHLIHIDQIKQDSPQAIMDIFSEYVMFENPLYITSYYPRYNTNLTYNRINGIDYLNGKKVLFWHMQTHFAKYLSKYLIMTKLLHSTNHMVTCDANDKHDLTNWIAERFDRLIGYSRLDVYRHFFDESDFLSVFSQAVWWNTKIIT